MAAHHHTDPDHDTVVGYGLWTQGYGVWKLRHALNWRHVAPFIIGGAIGVPIGTMLLTSINPEYLRTEVGVLLVLYSIYGLAQPAFKPIKAGVPADASIGVLNGLFAGVTGLPELIVTIWSQLRGWPKDVQRTVFQPVMLAAMAKQWRYAQDADDRARVRANKRQGYAAHREKIDAWRWRGPAENPAHRAKQRSYCPEKHRDAKLRYCYGMSLTDYDLLFERQRGACAELQGAIRPHAVRRSLPRDRQGARAALQQMQSRHRSARGQPDPAAGGERLSRGLARRLCWRLSLSGSLGSSPGDERCRNARSNTRQVL